MPVTTGISTVNTVVTGIHKGSSTVRPIVTESTNEQSPENKAVIQSELPSMDSTVEGGTLESIDLSAITPAGALVLHPSQEIFNDQSKNSFSVTSSIENLKKSTLNPTASEWMPRFGSVSEDREC